MWSRFIEDRAGGAAPIFALGIIPIIGLVGAAVDYSRGNAARTAMLASLDATALMLSRDAAGMDPAQITAKATSFFNAQFNRPEVANVQVTANLQSPQQGSFVLDVNASGNVPTTFTRLLGQEKLDIGSSAQVKWGVKKLELALVLDNTGSMASSGKLTQLKVASHNLLTTLADRREAAGRREGRDHPVRHQGEHRHRLRRAELDGLFGEQHPAEPVAGLRAGSRPAERHDRYDADLRHPHQVSGRAVLRPDHDDDADRHPRHDRLHQSQFARSTRCTAAGNTNVTIGLVWGWHALTKSEPLTQGSDPAPDKDKVIVLLTDGDNTQNRWGTSGSAIDARTAAACANAKAANIKIYTVRVIDGDANLLRNCASKPNMYYNVNQASQLNSVFSSIAQNLANLRIAK